MFYSGFFNDTISFLALLYEAKCRYLILLDLTMSDTNNNPGKSL